ncbi:MAG TPA: histone deacetylase [Anaerolineae bacterium]|nr:histone deacetylase [Anaerolineae bacterium]
MQLFYSNIFVLPLPEGHRFPMRKYSLLYERVARSELALAGAISMPPAASAEEITRAHDAEYLRRVMLGKLTDKELRRIGFPWSLLLVQRSLQTVGGTIAACRAALAEGVAINLAGGTHHAFADHGQGFCVFNDAVVAARTVQAEGLARQVLVIDPDVHQGNGTAALTRDDPSIFSFSIQSMKSSAFLLAAERCPVRRSAISQRMQRTLLMAQIVV